MYLLYAFGWQVYFNMLVAFTPFNPINILRIYHCIYVADFHKEVLHNKQILLIIRDGIFIWAEAFPQSRVIKPKVLVWTNIMQGQTWHFKLKLWVPCE